MMRKRLWTAFPAGLLAAALIVAPAQASSGAFERAWGKNVGGGGAFGVCTVAASCLAGTAGGLGGELDFPRGAATDGAGNVYVADTTNNRIQKFDSSGNFLLAWGKDVLASGGTGFEICTTRTSCKAGTAGGLGGELDFPEGVATDAVGNVYVADAFNNRLQKFDPSGNFLLTWGKNVNIFGGTGFETCNAASICRSGQTGGLGGELNLPWGVATVGGSISIADDSNNRIQKFDSSGNFLRAWGKDVVSGNAEAGFETCTAAASCKPGGTGGLGGEFIGPRGAVIDGAGNLYVADTGNNRIQKFGPSGNFLRTWGGDVVSGNAETGFEICNTAASCKTGVSGTLGGAFDNPNGVATGGAEDVYVADFSNNRIQKFDSAGNFLLAWGKDVLASGGTGFEICTTRTSCKAGTAGGLGGELNGPLGAATDAAGNLYVVDAGNHRIQVFGDVENVKPTVTINQAAGQTDPTNASPITFTVSFSETVTGFTGADVSFTGSTVGGTLAAAVSGSGANYTVSVSGMSGNGTVAASIPAGKAADLAGNPNLASTSSDNTVGFTSQDQGSSTGGSTGTTGTTGTGLQSTENPLCQVLRKKLKKAKTKPAKRKIRRKLRRLGC
jgi:sugar lactone lactonase YvrE